MSLHPLKSTEVPIEWNLIYLWTLHIKFLCLQILLLASAQKAWKTLKILCLHVSVFLEHTNLHDKWHIYIHMKHIDKVLQIKTFACAHVYTLCYGKRLGWKFAYTVQFQTKYFKIFNFKLKIDVNLLKKRRLIFFYQKKKNSVLWKGIYLKRDI